MTQTSDAPRATKPLIAALSGTRQDTPPIWLMRQAGRYLPEYRAIRGQVRDFLELCRTPSLATEVTLQPIRRYALDASIVFSDILMVPLGLGQDLAFREGEGPVLKALEEKDSLAGLNEVGFHDRVGAIYETLGRVARELPDRVALIGFAGAPWTVATYMIEGGKSVDFARARRWARDEPERMAALFALLERSTITYLDHQIRAGAEVYQLFDSWAGALADDAALFERWVIQPNARIVAALKLLHPTVPAIAFPREAKGRYGDFARAVGAAGLGLDTNVDLAMAEATLAPLATLQGNLDPLLLVEGGAVMEERIRLILRHLAKGPFIFNLGHGVVPQTNPAHVDALIAAVRRAGPAT